MAETAQTATPSDADIAYAEVVGLIERYVGNPGAQLALKRAVIEYGRLEAHWGIDSVTARLRGATNDV